MAKVKPFLLASDNAFEPPIEVKEAASFLKMAEVTVRRYARLGLIRGYKYPGGGWRFKMSELQEFVDSCARKPVMMDDPTSKKLLRQGG